MASFRRKAPAASQRSGTKPFLNGQTLVSSGLSELDAALGGGLLLQSLNLVEASSWSDSLAFDLFRYFVAEGVADGDQRVVVVGPEAAEFVAHQLPLELSLAQKQVKQQLERKEDASLTIAWQYGKYEQVKQARTRFCHSFDLSRSMHSEMMASNEPIAVDLRRTEGVSHMYGTLFETVEKLLEDAGGQVLRLAITGLGSPLFGSADAAHMTALFRFFRRLRGLFSSKKDVVGLVVLGSDVLSAFPAAFINELRHVSDSGLTLSSFAGSRDLLPDELQEFQGSLTMHKLPRMHALACHAPRNTRFGLKRERRKLKIEKFHLPPEGSRSSSNSSSCGSNTGSSGADPLAF